MFKLELQHSDGEDKKARGRTVETIYEALTLEPTNRLTEDGLSGHFNIYSALAD